MPVWLVHLLGIHKIVHPHVIHEEPIRQLRLINWIAPLCIRVPDPYGLVPWGLLQHYLFPSNRLR
jgi:hypothetical protein